MASKWKCKHCGDYQPKDTMKSTPRGKFCSWDHATAYAKEQAPKLLAKRAADEAKQERIRLRQTREKAMSLEEWVAKTQNDVNRVVRLLDRARGCISCHRPVDDCGHYFHRGSKYRTSPLTFYMLNLHGQCRHCNSFAGGGNQHEYREGMIVRYGQEAFQRLCDYKASVDRGEVPSLTVEACRELGAVMRAEARRLEKGLPPSRDWRALGQPLDIISLEPEPGPSASEG